jgi:hypothetical protein
MMASESGRRLNSAILNSAILNSAILTRDLVWERSVALRGECGRFFIFASRAIQMLTRHFPGIYEKTEV